MNTDSRGRLIKEEECNAAQIITSKYKSEPKQVKSEDVIDVVNHDLKCERYLEEVKEASHCEVCGEGLLSPTDFFSPDHSKFCSNCQCQNGPNAMQGEDMTLDLKQPTSDFGTSLFRTQEETIIGKEEKETEEITETLSFGHYSNSVKESRIHEENEDQSNNLNERTDVKSFENMSSGKMPLHHKIFKSSMKLHEKITTGHKSFQCRICSEYFIQKKYLKTHEKIHGEKLFHCKICSKSYKQCSTLNRHEKMHTGEKQFQCKFCSNAFFRKGLEYFIS
ncbi:uncharacterized protein isoform X2 [Leptinotarsa decemlineata]|uniref:uncharacterized protein isoform X2 n=1 Tax=Leptinotarsa decemlineata TaxID=7539 RepID=UPI003D309FBC